MLAGWGFVDWKFICPAALVPFIFPMRDTPSAETGDSPPAPEATLPAPHRATYLRASLKVVFVLLLIWFIVSFGCGIFFRSWLDEHAPSVGNAPFGFWMAQQGAVICFVVLLVVYAVCMNRLDRRFKVGEDFQEEQ